MRNTAPVSVGSTVVDTWWVDIAERTVKSHLHNIFQRLGVTHRTEAALWAQRNL